MSDQSRLVWQFAWPVDQSAILLIAISFLMTRGTFVIRVKSLLSLLLGLSELTRIMLAGDFALRTLKTCRRCVGKVIV